MDDKVMCGDCLYWEKSIKEWGYCKKHTPQLENGYDIGAWPQTKNDDWCFEGTKVKSSSSPIYESDPYNHDPYGYRK